jgi:hypothetical protein
MPVVLLPCPERQARIGAEDVANKRDVANKNTTTKIAV